MASSLDSAGLRDFAHVADVDEKHIISAQHLKPLGDWEPGDGCIGFGNHVEHRTRNVLAHRWTFP